jgi:release factor glutamine methyltransferase
MFLCYMQTVKDVYQEFRSALKSVYDASEIEALTNMVLSGITGFSKAKLKAFPDTLLTTEQMARASTILTDLQTGKPLQYILGHTEFYGLSFQVNSAVLIPRPETEELVEWIIETQQQQNPGGILDIGTGSGCIAISLKKHLPLSHVSAIDVSVDALVVARQNALLNNVDVRFYEANALNLVNAQVTEQLYQVIVSNPPYVTPADKELMHKNVTAFEPHTALFVSQNNPLLFYNAIADFARSHLITGGYLFFEINENYGQETIQLLTDKSFSNIKLRKDMSGRDRMIRAIYIR